MELYPVLLCTLLHSDLFWTLTVTNASHKQKATFLDIFSIRPCSSVQTHVRHQLRNGITFCMPKNFSSISDAFVHGKVDVNYHQNVVK